jgi:hypothetical protein
MLVLLAMKLRQFQLSTQLTKKRDTPLEVKSSQSKVLVSDQEQSSQQSMELNVNFLLKPQMNSLVKLEQHLNHQ